MSAVHFPAAMDSSTVLQVWNNAAFDNGEISEDLNGDRQSWGSLKSVFGNPKTSFDSVSDKENQGNVVENQISSLKPSSTPLKAANGGYEIKGFVKNEVSGVKKKKEIGDIDQEIEEIESQIMRLKSRLESLKLEKKQSAKKTEDLRVLNSNVKNKRGISLGPVEIISGGRRGMSMGPSEILGSGRKSSKMETITPIQSRRKSCFWKLEGINEEKGRSSSVSPKSRKLGSRAQVATRQAVTTIGSRKTLKKEENVMNSIQPKKLFRDGEKSVPFTNKKPLRPGRVIPSRYNQSSKNDTDNSKRVDKKRSLSPEKSRVVGSESRVKKRWEIPSEICVRVEGEKSPQSIVAVAEQLPRLRIARVTRDSPRDSGPAKKVVELIGKKSFFSNDEDVDPASLCQALSFLDEYDDEES